LEDPDYLGVEATFHEVIICVSKLQVEKDRHSQTDKSTEYLIERYRGKSTCVTSRDVTTAIEIRFNDKCITTRLSISTLTGDYLEIAYAIFPMYGVAP